MALVKTWDKEIKGKLWAVGDIHGCYNLLMTCLLYTSPSPRD